jgi:hypothetical protein
MMRIKDAIAEADAVDKAQDVSYTKLAEKHRVVRSTLTRQLPCPCTERPESPNARRTTSIQYFNA